MSALRFLVLLALAAPAAAQTRDLVFDFSPFEPAGVGGEMIVFGTEPMNIVHARVEATLVSAETGPWSMWLNFALPTGIAGVDSAVEGWAGAGTFSADFTTDALNGYVAPGEGGSYLWFVQWAGGAPFTPPGGGFGFGPMDGEFTLLRLTLTVVDAPPAAWLDLGHALAGTSGAPQLAGTGNLCRSAPGTLELSSAKPAATAFLVVGFGSLWTPFKGGTLLPAPGVVVPLPLDGTGAVSVPFTFPIGVPEGTQLWFQAWIPDPAGPKGFAASNGLLATVPSDC
jgi:hypothetical protein